MAEQLSPATQAVLNAFGKYPLHGDHIANNLMHGALPAAIDALADQVVPYLEEPNWGACDEMRCDIELYTDHMRKRSEILAIAAELRGQDQPSSEEP